MRLLIVLLVASLALAGCTVPEDEGLADTESNASHDDTSSDTQPTSTPTETPDDPSNDDTTTPDDPGIFRLAFADVDQGDGIALIAPDTVTVVDSGRNSASSHGGLTGYLDNHNVATVDHFFITHADADHSGGCDVIFAKYEVLNFYHSGADKDTITWQECLDAAETEGATIHSDLTNLDIGDELGISTYLETVILSIDAHDPDHNEGSISLRISHNGNIAILTGDIGCTTEQEIMDMFPASILDADVLQAGHHGSKYSTCTPWLAATTPEHVAISVGNNNYGHPTQEVIDRIHASGANLYRTDESGTIEFVSDGETWTVNVDPSMPNESEPEPEPPAGTSDLSITELQWDAPGSPDDASNANGEYVKICNTGDAQAMSGWRIEDAANNPNTYNFPSSFTLESNACVSVHSGSGSNTATELYWGRTQHVWNQSGDTAYLYDGATLVDEWSY